MTRSRGALPVTMIDRCYPFQVAFKEDDTFRKRTPEIHAMKYKLGAYALSHSFYFDEEQEYYTVYCFPTKAAAEAVLDTFFGEWIPSNAKREIGGLDL